MLHYRGQLKSTHATGLGKMRPVCLVRLGTSASSNVCNSYQIKLQTLVQTLSLSLTLFITLFILSFPYPKTEQYLP